MDAELARLRRDADADPGDGALARRLEQALLRVGRADEVRERYAKKYVCAQDLRAMRPGPEPGSRRCGECQRTVTLATSLDGLVDLLAAGRCAALQREGVGAALTRIVDDPRLDSAVEGRAPCLVPYDLLAPRRLEPR